MSKTEVIHARIRPDLKHSVEMVLEKVGLSTTDAISLFFHQIVLTEGLPFAVRIPNKATREAIADAKQGKNMRSYTSVEELRQAIEGRTRKQKSSRSTKKIK
jgi:DNA-damage-inducible protein J